MPEGEEQKIENLFEKIMKENFPNLVKERHTSPESTESQTRQIYKEAHSKMYHSQNTKG